MTNVRLAKMFLMLLWNDAKIKYNFLQRRKLIAFPNWNSSRLKAREHVRRYCIQQSRL